MQLPQDVSLSPLAMNHDERGWLTDIYRDEWVDDEKPCQWNVNFSQPNVLRGVHGRHWDYLVALRGRISATAPIRSFRSACRSRHWLKIRCPLTRQQCKKPPWEC